MLPIVYLSKILLGLVKSPCQAFLIRDVGPGLGCAIRTRILHFNQCIYLLIILDANAKIVGNPEKVIVGFSKDVEHRYIAS